MVLKIGLLLLLLLALAARIYYRVRLRRSVRRSLRKQGLITGEDSELDKVFEERVYADMRRMLEGKTYTRLRALPPWPERTDEQFLRWIQRSREAKPIDDVSRIILEFVKEREEARRRKAG